MHGVLLNKMVFFNVVLTKTIEDTEKKKKQNNLKQKKVCLKALSASIDNKERKQCCACVCVRVCVCVCVSACARACVCVCL